MTFNCLDSQSYFGDAKCPSLHQLCRFSFFFFLFLQKTLEQGLDVGVSDFCWFLMMTKWHVRPAKTQISLGICPVWSESSLSAWRKLGSLVTHWAQSEDSDQTGGKPSWSESSLGAHAILLVLSWGGSNMFWCSGHPLSILDGLLASRARSDTCWIFNKLNTCKRCLILVSHVLDSDILLVGYANSNTLFHSAAVKHLWVSPGSVFSIFYCTKLNIILTLTIH